MESMNPELPEPGDLERIDPLKMLEQLMERVRATTPHGPEHDVIEHELAEVRAKEVTHGDS